MRLAAVELPGRMHERGLNRCRDVEPAVVELLGERGVDLDVGDLGAAHHRDVHRGAVAGRDVGERAHCQKLDRIAGLRHEIGLVEVREGPPHS
jgi:hypothetical protein